MPHPHQGLIPRTLASEIPVFGLYPEPLKCVQGSGQALRL